MKQDAVRELCSRLEAAGRRHLNRWPHTDANELFRQLLFAELRRGTNLDASYEHLLELEPTVGPEGFELRVGGRARKRSGAYYTPPEFIESALDAALDPLINEPGRDLSQLRILDPACGSGRFLIAAGKRLAQRLGDARQAAECLHGIDRDPLAVELCRSSLQQSFGHPGRIKPGDGLSVHERFDLVIGNPPFVNGIEGERSEAARLRDQFPIVKGAADLAYFFLAHAVDCVRPGGRVALILPRPALSAPSLALLRESLPSHLQPNWIDAPDTSRRFRGALVFACLLVLGPDAKCRVRRGEALGEGTLANSNWWAGLNELIDGPIDRCGRATLESAFDISAGLTTAEAYQLKPFISEQREAPAGRLVTTGLIDPDTNHWGVRLCRFLGRDYQHPVVRAAEDLPANLRRRLAKARRPKILVAGLTKRVECVLDAEGASLGSVGTFAIWHPDDDVAALTRLGQWLHGTLVARLHRDELGANAVGGGDTVMTRAFLRGLPLPEVMEIGQS